MSLVPGLARLALPLAVAALAAGCGPKVAKPTSDSSPPTITWGITDLTDNTSQTQPASATITVKHGDDYLIVARGHDDQGLYHIELGTDAHYGCRGGDLGQSKTPDYPLQQHAQGPDANNQVQVDLIEGSKISTSTWSCQDGFSYSGGGATFHGAATNFFGGTATGELVVTVAP